MTEREWVSVYTTETDDAPRLDPVEVDSVKPLTPAELATLQLSRLLTPDARIVLRLYLIGKPAPVGDSRIRTR